MVERWSRIKDIQADWINRCSNLETLDYQVIKVQLLLQEHVLVFCLMIL